MALLDRLMDELPPDKEPQTGFTEHQVMIDPWPDTGFWGWFKRRMRKGRW